MDEHTGRLTGLQHSQTWRVLACNPHWGRGLAAPATGREVTIEIHGGFGDAAKDAALIEAAPQLYRALCLAGSGANGWQAAVAAAIATDLR